MNPIDYLSPPCLTLVGSKTHAATASAKHHALAAEAYARGDTAKGDEHLREAMAAMRRNPVTRGDILFEKAVARIDSRRVREWATSDQELPRLLDVADHVASRGGPQADPNAFATYIMLEAR